MIYEIYKYTGILDEDNIKGILSDTNKNKLLKGILMDCDQQNGKNKRYHFIFEEIIGEERDYDYLVIAMERGTNPNEIYIQDIARKLNDFQLHYKLSCVLADDNTVYLILYSLSNDNSRITDLSN